MSIKKIVAQKGHTPHIRDSVKKEKIKKEGSNLKLQQAAYDLIFSVMDL